MNTKGTDTSRALLPGMVLNNRYEIKRLLSFTPHHGVYLAKDVKITSRNWLIKEFIPEGITDEEFTRREEAYNATLEVILNFEHTAFPGILDSFNSLGRWYLVTEPIDGLTLRAISSMSIEPLKESQILEWALQICDALLYLHSRPKPFIGSLLDPDHIMVVMGDESEQIRLVNLGLSPLPVWRALFLRALWTWPMIFLNWGRPSTFFFPPPSIHQTACCEAFPTHLMQQAGY